MKTNAIVLAAVLTAFGAAAVAVTPQAEHAVHVREHQVWTKEHQVWRKDHERARHHKAMAGHHAEVMDAVKRIERLARKPAHRA